MPNAALRALASPPSFSQPTILNLSLPPSLPPSQLHFHRNADGELACPSLGKVFTDHSRIAAVRTTGNVYSLEALEELCLKPKNFRDLLTDEPFARADVLVLQDPRAAAAPLRDPRSFHHVTAEGAGARGGGSAAAAPGIRAADADTQRALAAIGGGAAGGAAGAARGVGARLAEAHAALAAAKGATAAPGGAAGAAPPPAHLRPPPAPAAKVARKPGTATWNTDAPGAPPPGARGDPSAGRRVPRPYSRALADAPGTTGAAMHSFTSTSMPLATRSERARAVVQLRPTTKGYARLSTSLGDLNLELHADVAPRACENFLALAESGYYDGTVFHRIIKSFMAQGGDPTGTGNGGASVFGPAFADEIDGRLRHAGRGVLSMANAGPHTNGSQFFVTFASAPHLDGKHTIFGKVVGGFDALTALERVAVGADDRPLEEVRVTGVQVFVNPYKEMMTAAKAETAAAEKAEAEKAAGRGGAAVAAPLLAPAPPAGVGGGVGKYLAADAGAGAAAPGAGRRAAPAVDLDAW